jgi:hypothetical protein
MSSPNSKAFKEVTSSKYKTREKEKEKKKIKKGKLLVDRLDPRTSPLGPDPTYRFKRRLQP